MKALSALLISTLAVAAPMAPAAHAAGWDDAQAAFDARDDRAAIAHLRAAAGEGDRRAQTALGLALLHGDRLFPGVLPTDRAQGAQWLATALATLPDRALPVDKRTRLGLHLTPGQARTLKSMGGRAVLFVDVRSRNEVDAAGLPALVDRVIPYREHEATAIGKDAGIAGAGGRAPSDFVAEVGRALTERRLGPDATIVLICRSGNRSARAADLLAANGYRQVYAVPAGFDGDLPAGGGSAVSGWKQGGLPWWLQRDAGMLREVGPSAAL